MFDLDYWLWGLVVTAMGVVSMAILACAVSLARDTTGHDWYAAGKLTLNELLIGIGANDSAPVEYRTSRGEVLTLTRQGLRFNGNALVARGHVLRTARNATELGAWCGFGGALLCLALFRRENKRWPQSPAQERVSERAGSKAPVREPPEGPPDSRDTLPTGSERGGKRHTKEATGKTEGRSKSRRADRRKRNYDRWI